jgi:hypothetical protein
MARRGRRGLGRIDCLGRSEHLPLDLGLRRLGLWRRDAAGLDLTLQLRQLIAIDRQFATGT